MNPSIVDQAQQQAQGNFGNDFGSVTPSGLASEGSTLDQARQALEQQQSAAPSAAAPAQSGNLFTRLLPTGAGILGALVSGGLDLGTGGLATALDPAIVGAFTAAGKAGENALTGQKVLQGNDLTAGAEGAAGQLGGNLVGKGLSAVGGKLVDIGANRAQSLSDASDAADSDAAAQQGIQSRATAYKDVPVKLQQLYNAKDSLDHVANMGFDETNPQNLVNMSNSSNDLLNSNLDSGLSSADPVDLSNYNDLVKNRLAEESGTLGSYEPTVLRKGQLGPAGTPASKVLGQLETLGMGTARTESDPQAVRQLITKIGGLANDAKPTVSQATGAIDPQQRATYNVLSNIRNDLKGVLYNRDSVNEALGNMQPNVQAADVGGSQQLADHLNDVIGNAGKNGQVAAQDYLDEISKNIDVNNLGQEGLKAGQVVTSTGAQDRALTDAGVAKPQPQGNSSMLNKGIDLAGGAEALLGHHPALGLGMVAANHLAQNPAAISGAGGILKSLGDSSLPNVAGTVLGTSPNDVAGPASGNNAVQLPQMNQGNSVLDQALYEAMQNPLNGGLSQISTLLPMVQKANEAQQAEQALTGNFNQAGGAQGPLGGILSRLGSTFTGGEAASYPAQAAAEAQAIAQATGVPAAQVESSLPKITQNGTAAQASLGNINSLIQSLLLQQGQGSQGGGSLMGAVY